MKLKYNGIYVKVLLSIAISIIGWFVVVSSISPDDQIVFSQVPISVDLPTGVQLSKISMSSESVDVTVEGARISIGALTKSDIRIKLVTTEVSRPGEYELPLMVEQSAGSNWRVLRIYPEKVTVEFDRIVSKQLYVEKLLENINVQSDTHVLGDIRMEPSSVTITGPESDVSKVERAVVSYTLPTNVLTRSLELDLPIVLLDGQERKVKTIKESGGTLDIDRQDCALSISVLEKKTVPLNISFTNRHSSLPLERLAYTIIPSELTLVGDTSALRSYNSVNVGYIDISTLDPNQRNIYDFNLELPNGIKSISGESEVIVQFNKVGMSKKTFKVGNIELLNVPDGYSISTDTKSINVTLVGSDEELKTLEESSLLAEVDFAGIDVNVGSMTVDAKIVITNDALAWAYGKYRVQVDVK